MRAETPIVCCCCRLWGRLHSGRRRPSSFEVTYGFTWKTDLFLFSWTLFLINMIQTQPNDLRKSQWRFHLHSRVSPTAADMLGQSSILLQHHRSVWSAWSSDVFLLPGRSELCFKMQTVSPKSKYLCVSNELIWDGKTEQVRSHWETDFYFHLKQIK